MNLKKELEKNSRKVLNRRTGGEFLKALGKLIDTIGDIVHPDKK